ncbi:integrin-linked protein kinase isoform X2 [Lingula anatina]|uniref:Integrin-linked protein kinase isoform X2 n=1 Tax=Lingula anatina TaxID=7574 RepID=A0A1S3INI6_LINAN|nr:integrin-linked protein kinase isoform X2 [Lingula anatina]|eukprot:XP_013399638.1 integrin-linked protein kinase isoform X2 [Lingula anatina]
MDDIFTQVREGNAFHVRVWLDNTENDLNQGDDHRFSLLHWASREGRTNIVDMLIQRGARINATNMGDDTALHLAASHGHRDIVLMLLHNKANINAINEHGNTPLHYSCFWSQDIISEDLVNNGALVSMCNKFGETPLDKAKPRMAKILKDRAVALGQDLNRIPFKDRSWLGYKTRSRDATLSRNAGIDISQLALTQQISNTHSGSVWRGTWQGNDIVAKILKVQEVTSRIARDFMEEFPRLRIFNHPNILPVLGACNDPQNLIVISQFMPFGSLYNVLHEETGLVIDQNQALRFSLDVARGMEFLHTLEPMVPNFYLTSRHVLIDEDLTARINMADYKFSFHERGKLYAPAWLAPEALQRKPSEINVRAADMWSFAILLWELATREVPFADMSPMEIGMKVALEGLRVQIPLGTSQHTTRLVKICMNEEPGKRPRFDMVIPILEKMKLSS